MTSMDQNYKKKRKTAFRRKIAAIGISIIMLFTLTGCADTASETQSHLDAKNGVVVVSEYVALDGVEAGVAHGSGFFIGKEGEDPQYLVTNHHVIADYLYFGAGQLASYTDEDGTTYALKSYVRVYFDSRDYVEAYVVGYNEVADVALLRIASPTSKRRALKLCSPTGNMVGSTVYAIGYPGVADNPVVDSVTSWGLEDLTFTSGIISRLTTTSGTGVQNIQVDVSIGHGNSGGPIVNENGSAVGISAWGYMNENAEEAAYAVNIDEVITLLNLYGIAYTMENESGTAGSPAIIIGIVAGLLVLLIIVAVVIILSKKKKKSAASSVLSPTTGVSSTDDTGYRLQGVAGSMEGRRFMIRKNTPLTFGRNAEACNVAFPAATAGVSGKHCQVWYDNGTVWIKDLGSSHGTFLMTGKKLAAGQAMQIRPGERFSLGSDAETFVLVQKGGN
ncbi:MAG: trypsin-like peptidase domain-containing protein [Ruminococcus sp.]|nr:trypsin-like peptidase domain-containing protein [Ruminococcus sp.]